MRKYLRKSASLSHYDVVITKKQVLQWIVKANLVGVLAFSPNEMYYHVTEIEITKNILTQKRRCCMY